MPAEQAPAADERAVKPEIGLRKSVKGQRSKTSSNKEASAPNWLWWLWWGIPVLLLLISIGLQGAILTGKLRHGARQNGAASSRGTANASVGYGSANGVFPKGCRWREVKRTKQGGNYWAVQEYEYWNEKRKVWSKRQPASCLVRGHANPKSWQWLDKSPKTQVGCDDNHCLYQNLWHNNGKWYLLVADGNPPVDWWAMTRNQELRILHVGNASKFVQNLDVRVVKGDTLIFDFVFFLHPTAIGHWGEMMFPLYSILRDEKEFSVPPDQFLMLHLKRVHLMEWARSVIAATLQLGPQEALPPIMVQQEQSNVWNQIPQPLEGVAKHEWLCFERALVVRDIFNGGVRTFLKREDAIAFRQAIYRNHGLPPPQHRTPPRLITFQRKRANRRIINEEQFIRLLETYAEVRVVEFDANTPFKEQLEIIASTGVFISAHTSNLANAQFLQPGSAVFEVIQRNWVWADMDRSFKVQTEMMGDIHHFAWRARFRNQTVYIDPRDGERFGYWPPHLCTTEECVEAHTNVDVVVNLQEFKALLDSRLPFVFNGTSVADAEIPWPPGDAEKPYSDEDGFLDSVLNRRAGVDEPPDGLTSPGDV